MNRRSLLQWIALTAILATAFFLSAPSTQAQKTALDPLDSSLASDIQESGTVISIAHPSIFYCITTPQDISPRTHDLPLQGRSFVGLLSLTPGTAVEKTQPSRILMKGQSTSFFLDGVNMNAGIVPGGESPGNSASGNVPALTASGGANGIATLDATKELSIQSSHAHLELNRGDGPRIEVTSQAGTNNFHGSASHFFGNDAFDASDWFANARNLNKPPKRLNIFAANLGGPILLDKTFFFAAYEGLRLRQPVTGITDVPSLSARQSAPAAIRRFLEAFPLPTAAPRPDGFAEFAATFSNPARHDVGNFRLDHWLNANTRLNGRYSFADSDASLRGGNGFSLNTTNRIGTHAQSITGSLLETLTSTVLLEFRANYSRTRVNSSYLLDQFGGATIPVFDTSGSSSFAFDLNSRNAAFMIGDDTRNIQRQINLVGSITMVSGDHWMTFGGDYRRLSPIISMRRSEQNVFFDGVSQAITGTATRMNELFHGEPQTPLFKILSLYGHDQWKASSRFTLSFGMRWEPGFAPSHDRALAVDQVNDPANLKAVTPGTPLWDTTVGNFAPRASFAYSLVDPNYDEFLIRGGVNILYDRGHDRSGNVFANSIPFISGSTVPLLAFDPHLKLPYTINWNVMLRKAVGGSQYVHGSYAGSSGKRLLHTETLFNRNPEFPFLRITTNRGGSDHRALQFSFQRMLRNNLAALVSYTWSHSTDNVIFDSDRNIVMTSSNPELDYGPSDFHSEHELAGFMSYDLPAPFSKGLGNTLLRKWHVDSIFNARSAKPLNVFYLVPTSIGVAYFRPDVVNGASLYLSDPSAPGGRRINQAAFIVPTALRQGTLGRNSLGGFPLYQIDLGLRRNFNFTDDFWLQFEADAFNLFNHTNFEDPLANDLVVGSTLRSNSAFGESTSLSGRNLSSGGFASFYGRGGARTLRFSLKLVF